MYVIFDSPCGYIVTTSVEMEIQKA